MGTDSEHRCTSTNAIWVVLGGAVAAGAVAFSAILLSSLAGMPPRLAAVTGALVVAGATFVAIRVSIMPRQDRSDRAVARIQKLAAEGPHSGDGAPVSGADSESRELVARLEHSADHVASTIDKLKTIENYRQEFLGDVSHELQTPIFAVQGFAETLLEGALEDPAVNRAFVEKILRHSERLSSLVNDLSHISQIETGSLKMNLEAFDPRKLIGETVESLEINAEAARIELLSFVAPDLRFAIGDRMRIRQVLENLISNGIKYNDEGGRVETTARRTETGKALFSVTDDGIGLAPEHFDRVTERFYRVDKSRSRERGGTGLGLAIVKHILEAHGSKLNVSSRFGRGSTFSFELDVTPPHQPPDVS